MRFSAFIKSLVIFVSLLFVFLLVKTPSFAQTITPQVHEPFALQEVDEHQPVEQH